LAVSGRGCGGCRACGHRPLDVGLDDPPAGPGARDRLQLEPALTGDPPGERRGLDPPVPGRGGNWFRSRPRLGRRLYLLPATCWLSFRGSLLAARRRLLLARFLFRLTFFRLARFLLSLCLGRSVTGRRRLPRLADPRDHLADRQRGALLGDDLDQGAAGVGLVDHVRLVGLDLDQLLALRHLVPDRLQPAQDRPLLHRVGQAGHDDFRRHQGALPGAGSR
jgi:hypothetical protein